MEISKATETVHKVAPSASWRNFSCPECELIQPHDGEDQCRLRLKPRPGKFTVSDIAKHCRDLELFHLNGDRLSAVSLSDKSVGAEADISRRFEGSNLTKGRHFGHFQQEPTSHHILFNHQHQPELLKQQTALEAGGSLELPVIRFPDCT
ncbi:hypothetical protein ElyMa_001131000 [Elysia marginata]|uniref:Uncharacterized protein n=1 Tax=Elysia marginata TaxID=1093978 RepID=A0AAV4I198_9GAST|nr:hypothetical protein ElyMa_001131000 [Elysia marginata]